jgi:hypothetical protein
VSDNNPEEPDGPQPTPTWILIRATPSDRGLRTPPVPQFWASPDIAAAPADPLGRVVQGQPVTVSATVQNLGFMPTKVHTRFWWVDPSAGINLSAATLIGAAEPTTIVGGNAATLDCTTLWIPEFVNGGHECLVVEAFSTEDPVVFSLRADLDRHVGQRNMTVLPADAETTPMMLTLANPFDRALPTEVRLRSDVVAGAQRLIGLDLPTAAVDAMVHVDDPALSDLFTTLGIEHGPVDPGAGVEVGDVVPRKLNMATLSPDDQAALRATASDGADAGVVVAAFKLEAGATAGLELRPASGGTGSAALVHRLTQITDGVVVGGYTVVSPPF